MSEQPTVPLLEAPEIAAEDARALGLVWAEPESGTPEPPPAREPENRLLVPEQWVEDAVRAAVEQYRDEIVRAAVAELRDRMESLR